MPPGRQENSILEALTRRKATETQKKGTVDGGMFAEIGKQLVC